MPAPHVHAVRALDRLRREADEPTMRAGTYFAGLATYSASALLLSDTWWGIALCLIFAAGFLFVICFRELSGSEEGRVRSSKELAVHAAGSVLTLALIGAITISAFVLLG